MDNSVLKILIIGGYGTFGGRLAELLADEAALTLVIAGRSAAKASAFCKTLNARAHLTAQIFDRDGDVPAQLKQIRPDIVVDATGPFQNYGENPYRVVEACIALAIHYLDLADGSDFVKGIAQFDARARANGIMVLSGVSSFPVLTAAVVRTLAQGLTQVQSITGGIAPSPYAGVGLNVIRSVMSYAGQPIALQRGGKPATAYALTESMRYTICPPGQLPLDNLHFSLVDVPDLQLLPEEWPGLNSIWMGVAPVPEILHRMLNGLAQLVKHKIIATLLPCAWLFHRVINILRWGEHRGGMFVAIRGTTKDGSLVERSWHLLAEEDDGPMIPSMAAEGIIRNLLNGKMPPAGARAATGDLELTDYDRLFANRTIYTGLRGMQPMPADAPLYQRILEDGWNDLPPEIRAMHNLKGKLQAEGNASIERGTGWLASKIAQWFHFPAAADNVPVKVTFTLKDGEETWRRDFGNKMFESIQSQGEGRSQGLLTERFGAFRFGLALVLKHGRLSLVVRRWSLCGIPLPCILAPGGNSYEYVKEGRFHFHVEITHPLFGLIVRYQGGLVVQPAA